MKSGKICRTQIRTEGRVKGEGGAEFVWDIGDGVVTIDGEGYSPRQYDIIWDVTTSDTSLDKVIAFLQKVRKETKKKRKKRKARTSPPDIQSTSSNRILLPGTTALYWPNA
jgi:hypothetical protein